MTKQGVFKSVPSGVSLIEKQLEPDGFYLRRGADFTRPAFSMPVIGSNGVIGHMMFVWCQEGSRCLMSYTFCPNPKR